MADRVGQQFGSYRLTHLIGRGGSAEVYLGQHVKVKDHKAAIKIVRGYMGDDKSRKDFLHEARILARLKHPHITQLLDFDIHDNIPFIVMTYAPHGNLAQKHPNNEPVPLDLILHYVKQIGLALQHAHEQDIVHCDLKPNNLLIGPDKTILVSDFGFARLLRTTSRSETSHRFGATLFYCAPEQFHRHPTIVSDQYALGVILYQWFSGRPPFDGTPQQLMYQHMHTPPPSLRNVLPDLPPQVEQVVLKTLAKEPQQRFATIQQFVAALEEAAGSALYQAQPSSSYTVTNQKLQTTSQMLEHALPCETPESTSAYKKQSMRPLTEQKHTTPAQSPTSSMRMNTMMSAGRVIVLLLGLFLLAGALHLTIPQMQQASDFLKRATMHTQGLVVPSKDYQSSGFNGTTMSNCTSVVQVNISNRNFTIPNEGCSADINMHVAVIYDPHDPQGAKVEFGAQQELNNAIFSIIGAVLSIPIGTGWLMSKLRSR